MSKLKTNTRTAFRKLIVDLVELHNEEFDEHIYLSDNTLIDNLKLSHSIQSSKINKLIKTENDVDDWFEDEFENRGICESILNEGCKCDDRFCYKYIRWRDEKNISNQE